MLESEKFYRIAENFRYANLAVYLATQFNVAYYIPDINQRAVEIFDGYASNFSGANTIYNIGAHFLPEKYRLSPVKSALLTFAICNGREIAQAAFGKGDPIDVILNTVGIGLAFGIDHFQKKGRDRWNSRHIS